MLHEPGPLLGCCTRESIHVRKGAISVTKDNSRGGTRVENDAEISWTRILPNPFTVNWLNFLT